MKSKTSKECINKMVEKYSWLGKEYCRLIENENPYKPNQQTFEEMADKVLKDLDRLEQYDKALEDKYDYSKCPCFDELMIRCKHLEKENQELKAKGKELLNDFHKTLEIANKYKKAIEILNEEPYILEFGLESFTYDKFDNTYYYELEIQGYDGLDFRKKIYGISKEKYDLLKDVLGCRKD